MIRTFDTFDTADPVRFEIMETDQTGMPVRPITASGPLIRENKWWLSILETYQKYLYDLLEHKQ